MNKSKSHLAVATALTAAACKKDAPKPDGTNGTSSKATESSAATAASTGGAKLEFVGDFGPNAARPVRDGEPDPVKVPDKVVKELSAVAPERIEAAFLGRKLPKGQPVTVSFGGDGANDGLMLTIAIGKTSASHRIPPATNSPELVSNLDHTTERVLDEIGVPRSGGAL